MSEMSKKPNRNILSQHFPPDDGVPRIASENYVSSNGVEAGDDEDLRADREEQLLAGGRCGDESPRVE